MQKKEHKKADTTNPTNKVNIWLKERTLVVIKPDGVQRSLIGEIVARYERLGLKLIAMKMFHPSPDHVEKHYTLDPDWLRLTGEKSIANRPKTDDGKPTGSSVDPLIVGRKILGQLVEYLAAGPVVAMVWQGAHAVAIVRKITGSTEPLSSDVGTIRGDFVLDSYEMSDSLGRSIRNLVHASSSPREAENEIAHWFTKEELHDYVSVGEMLV